MSRSYWKKTSPDWKPTPGAFGLDHRHSGLTPFRPLAIVKSMAGRIESVDDKLSKLASSQPPGAAASSLPANPATIDAVTLVNGLMTRSSWNGIKVMKACQLANLRGRVFDLRAICTADSRMSYDYAYGYLVATSSIGLFSHTTDAQQTQFTIPHFPEIVRVGLESEILARTSQTGPDVPVMKAEITAIEKLIESAPVSAQPTAA